MRSATLVLVGALSSLSVLLLPSGARACGGLFCNSGTPTAPLPPINQSGERIVFTFDSGKVEAQIQIQYAGEARKFAWVVPVDSRPTLSIGSQALMSALDNATAPAFPFSYGRRSCQVSNGSRGVDAGALVADAGVASVVVVSREQVGPYDAAVLTATSAADLSTWLSTNGYELTGEGKAALGPYVGAGKYFVALRLQQDKGIGDLRPIALTFARSRPCVPIRLTAIAAQRDMPIVIYAFGPGRAVPENYKHVVLNLSRIDWFQQGANYRDLASAAINEAGGQAFLTEFDGVTPISSAGSFNTFGLAAMTHPVDFVVSMGGQGFATTDVTVLPLLRRYVPRPAAVGAKGVSESAFYASIAQYRSDIDGDPGRVAFDAVGFAGELEEVIAAPAKHANAILLGGRRHLTRLLTILSPDEMTVDPELTFNADLPAVPNVSSAQGTDSVALCDATPRTTVQINLGTAGSYVVPAGGTLPGPAALRIEQLSATGAALPLTDNGSLIAAAMKASLDAEQASLSARAATPGVPSRGLPPSTTAPSATGCGCASAAAAPLLILTPLLLLFRRRRG